MKLIVWIGIFAILSSQNLAHGQPEQRRVVIAFESADELTETPKIGQLFPSESEKDEGSEQSDWFWPLIIGGSVGALALTGLAFGGAYYFAAPASAQVTLHLPN